MIVRQIKSGIYKITFNTASSCLLHLSHFESFWNLTILRWIAFTAGPISQWYLGWQGISHISSNLLKIYVVNCVANYRKLLTHFIGDTYQQKTILQPQYDSVFSKTVGMTDIWCHGIFSGCLTILIFGQIFENVSVTFISSMIKLSHHNFHSDVSLKLYH